MKKHLFIMLIVSFFHEAIAQPDMYKEWDKTYAQSIAADWLLDIIQTTDKGYIACGFADGWAHPGIHKLDAGGITEWDYAYYQPANPLLRGQFSQVIELNDVTGYVAVGFHENTTYGDRAGFLMKFNSTGVPVNTLYYTQGTNFTYETVIFESIEEIPVADGGGFIVAGWSRNTTATESDAFLMRLDDSFNIIWVQNYDNQLKDFTNRVVITYDIFGSATGFAVTGSIENSTSDVWVFHTNLSGVFNWEKEFDSNTFNYNYNSSLPVGPCNPLTPSYNDGTRSILQSSDGNLVVLGMFNRYFLGAGSCFDSNGNPYPEYLSAEIAMFKLDVSNGNTIFSNHIVNHSGADFHTKAVEDPAGNFYVVGTSAAETAPDLLIPGRMDNILITKVSAAGTTIWNKPVTNGECTCGFGIAVTDDDNNNIADDGLIVCGNDDVNGDEYVWVKLTNDCTLADFSVFGFPEDATCNGSDDGSIDLYPVDGLAPITYTWSGGQTTEDISSLIPGNYSVIIDDACGNQTSYSTTISEPASIPYTFTLNNSSCAGSNDGSIDVVPAGIPPYIFLWSNGETTSSITNLAPGNYSVTINDASTACTVVNFTITEPLAIAIITTTTNETCDYSNDGTASASVTGGTGAYYYLWNDPLPQTTATATGLPAGTYDVVVTDDNGCSATQSVTITEPAPLSIIMGAASETCFDSENGNAFVSVSGGTGAYYYQWDDPLLQTTSSATGLSAGTYSVTVTDDNGCIITQSVVIGQPAPIVISITTTSETCDYSDDGTATASASGGNGGFSYQWDDPLMQSTATATGLSAGIYNVTATDFYGCSMTQSTTITEPGAISVSFLTNDSKCDFTNNGLATALISGGTGPYTYQWNDENLQTSQTAVGLTPASYIVTVTDANGCIGNGTALIGIAVTSVAYDYTSDVYITSNTQVFADQNSDGIIKMNGRLFIEPGVNYTIDNKIVEFASVLFNPVDLGLPGSGVVVKTNAKLTLKNNTTLRGITECENMWDGVQVWGDQLITIPPVPLEVKIHHILSAESYLQNGKLIMNNAQIQDAHTGVSLYRPTIPFAAPPPVEYGRGILEATSSRFINNRVSVAFSGYTLINNYSFIKGCTFTNNAPMIDDLKYNGKGMLSFISLSRVKKVKITASEFNGNLAFTEDLRGTAIYSYDASYNVESGTVGIVPVGSPLTPNEFNDLTKGVDAFSTGGINKNIKIRDNRFINVQQGIIANGTSFDEISFNQFEIPAGTATLNTWGVFLYGTYGFITTENIFNTISTSPYTYGAIARNTYLTGSEIYHNNFTGAFESGTQMEQDNSNLELKCNEYTNTNTFDWAITSGILVNQGDCSGTDLTTRAGNKFDNCLSSDESQIFVDPSASAFSYSCQSDIVPLCYSTSVTVIPCSNTFVESTDCPITVDIPCGTPCIQVRKIDFNNEPPGFVKELKKAGLFRAMLHNEKISGLLEILATNPSNSDLKMLIATYLSYGHCEQAQETLERISGTSIPDIQFKQLYSVLIGACEDGRTEKELTNNEKQTIRDIALVNDQFSVHAQSVLTASSDFVYIREPERTNVNRSVFADNSDKESKDNNLFDVSMLKVYPNPLNETANFEFYVPEGTNASQIVIYDLSGKSILSINITGNSGTISVNNLNLNSGTYLCALINGEQALTKTLFTVMH